MHPRESDAVSSYVPTLKLCPQVPRYQQGLRSAFQHPGKAYSQAFDGETLARTTMHDRFFFLPFQVYLTGKGTDSAVVSGLDVGVMEESHIQKLNRHHPSISLDDLQHHQSIVCLTAGVRGPCSHALTPLTISISHKGANRPQSNPPISQPANQSITSTKELPPRHFPGGIRPQGMEKG